MKREAFACSGDHSVSHLVLFLFLFLFVISKHAEIKIVKDSVLGFFSQWLPGVTSDFKV